VQAAHLERRLLHRPGSLQHGHASARALSPARLLANLYRGHRSQRRSRGTRTGRPLPSHRNQPRPARALRRSLLRPHRRRLVREARGAPPLQLSPSQHLRPVASLQPYNRPLRRHLLAQRHALLLSGNSAHAAGLRSPPARPRTAFSSSAPANSPPTFQSGPPSSPAGPATTAPANRAKNPISEPSRCRELHPQHCDIVLLPERLRLLHNRRRMLAADRPRTVEPE
jgi:hypothetical protein